MQILGEKGLGNTLKVILQICLYLGIVVLIPLPFILQAFEVDLIKSMVIMYPNGVSLLMITNSFIKLFDSLKENNPFCDKNVKILKRTAFISLTSSCFWTFDLIYCLALLKDFQAKTILILSLMIILFFGVAIALLILSELFKQATEYKKENELTI